MRQRAVRSHAVLSVMTALGIGFSSSLSAREDAVISVLGHSYKDPGSNTHEPIILRAFERRVDAAGPKSESCAVLVAKAATLDPQEGLVDEEGNWRPITTDEPTPLQKPRPSSQGDYWAGNVTFEPDPDGQTLFLVQAVMKPRNKEGLLYSEPQPVVIDGRLDGRKQAWGQIVRRPPTPPYAMLHRDEWSVLRLFPETEITHAAVSGKSLYVITGKDTLYHYLLGKGTAGAPLTLPRAVDQLTPQKDGVVVALSKPAELLSIRNIDDQLTVTAKARILVGEKRDSPPRFVRQLSSSETHNIVAIHSEDDQRREEWLGLADMKSGKVRNWKETYFTSNGMKYERGFSFIRGMRVSPRGDGIYVFMDGRLNLCVPAGKDLEIDYRGPEMMIHSVPLARWGNMIRTRYDVNRTRKANGKPFLESFAGNNLDELASEGVLLGDLSRPEQMVGALMRDAPPYRDPGGGAVYTLDSLAIDGYLDSPVPLTSITSSAIRTLGWIGEVRFEEILGIVNGILYVKGTHRSQNAILALTPPAFMRRGFGKVQGGFPRMSPRGKAHIIDKENAPQPMEIGVPSKRYDRAKSEFSREKPKEISGPSSLTYWQDNAGDKISLLQGEDPVELRRLYLPAEFTIAGLCPLGVVLTLSSNQVWILEPLTLDVRRRYRIAGGLSNIPPSMRIKDRSLYMNGMVLDLTNGSVRELTQSQMSDLRKEELKTLR